MIVVFYYTRFPVDRPNTHASPRFNLILGKLRAKIYVKYQRRKIEGVSVIIVSFLISRITNSKKIFFFPFPFSSAIVVSRVFPFFEKNNDHDGSRSRFKDSPFWQIEFLFVRVNFGDISHISFHRLLMKRRSLIYVYSTSYVGDTRRRPFLSFFFSDYFSTIFHIVPRALQGGANVCIGRDRKL